MPQIDPSIYKQLAQNVSDSEADDDDSEDEVVRFQTQPRSAAHPNGVTAAVYSPKFDNHPILLAPRTEMLLSQGRHVLELDGAAAGCVSAHDTIAMLNEGGINSTNTQDDETAVGHIIGGHQRKPMSPCRRVCFYLSIFVCFASVVIFLFGLPCNNELTCPVRNEQGIRGGESGVAGDEDGPTGHNWIKQFEKVEFKSVISVTRTTTRRSGGAKNVIFLYRCGLRTEMQNRQTKGTRFEPLG